MRYAIIGGGIGGLTTAIYLEKLGIDYQVFERAESIKAVGAGIWLAPNALQVMDDLGLLEAVQQKGNSINRITLATKNMEPLSDTSQQFVKDEFGYTTISIHRGDLQSLLANQIPKEKLNTGKCFQSYKIIDDNKVEVKFTDGSTYLSDFLIGADGIHSQVRQQLFPKSKTRYSGQTCWRGVTPFNLDNDVQHQGIEMWGDGLRFGISAVSHNKVYWFAVAQDKPKQKDGIEGRKDKLLKLFSDFYPLAGQLIEATDHNQIFRSDINDLQPLKHWSKGPVCLIGDAGHATTPNLGQGGAQAIEDAYCLGQLLNNNIDSIFKVFENKRKEKVNKIVKQSWQMGQVAHWTYGTSFRNTIMRNMPIARFKKQLIKLYQLH